MQRLIGSTQLLWFNRFGIREFTCPYSLHKNQGLFQTQLAEFEDCVMSKSATTCLIITIDSRTWRLHLAT